MKNHKTSHKTSKKKMQNAQILRFGGQISAFGSQKFGIRAVEKKRKDEK